RTKEKPFKNTMSGLQSSLTVGIKSFLMLLEVTAAHIKVTAAGYDFYCW
ncbi:hypothetical protein Tco_1521978, partial [Tanacetum coccineum]